MEYINISHKRYYQNGRIFNFSSERGNDYSINNILHGEDYWSNEAKIQSENEYFIIEYDNIITIDLIELLPSVNGNDKFPQNFRIEMSINGKEWKIIQKESNFELDSNIYKLHLPLTQLKFLKVLIFKPANQRSNFNIEISKCLVGISGIKKIKASSTSLKERSAANLFNNNTRTYWESGIKSIMSQESLYIDLGSTYQMNRIQISATDKGFPEKFIINTSVDENIWTQLLEEKSFSAEFSKKYYWDFNITHTRYIKIETRGVKLTENSYGLQIEDVAILAAPFTGNLSLDSGDITPYASIFQAGIVKLSKDGEDFHGSVVQASDSRLKNASTIFKGIVQLAESGDERNGFAVQASDFRLKQANEKKPGITRLAYDRESKSGTAVQGNDSRLKDATFEKPGIVKLCPDGLYTEHGVIRGNDSRIQKATTNSFGICLLATDGDKRPGTVVQGNDSRLRNASTTNKGIVELAEDGESNPGVAVQGDDKRLKDATAKSKGIVELADDGEDKPGTVVQGDDKRLKDATTTSKGIVELADDGEEKPGAVVQSNDRRLKDSTTTSKGIVELADDGEDSPFVVVQGNDKRLKDAATTSKGIVRLAKNGEDSPNVAVQGNDKRLKDATTTSKGIVELAENGEDNPNVAVQGNDRRLKDATTGSKGIVELADDGEDRASVAVQGNDKRLKDATTTSKGIVRLAKNGEVSIDAAVQSNDRRLRNATATAKGIVELADDGEDNPDVAVQGNDKRLKDATTTSKGIVELAENGENSPNVAVQGNDKRLKKATINNHGIVKLAKNKEESQSLAVQANDERLFNSRTPLPHSHNYAPKDHSFNSHSGTIYIKSSKNEAFNEITPPSDKSSIIQASNSSKKSGSIGISGIAGNNSKEDIQAYGVVGHSSHIGIRGQSTGGELTKGCGVLGISRFGAGGVFSSEHTYAIVADGFGKIKHYDGSLNLKGNGDALLVNGHSEFNGKININNHKKNHPMNIAEYFEVEESEYISPGDLLSVSEEGNSILCRCRSEYNTSVIGVVSGNPTVTFNNSEMEKKTYPVILTGKALCKVDARNNPIMPGDLIVSSNTPGCGMKGKIDSFNKIGSTIGKALDKLDDGIGVIPIFIIHQ